jgi:hypothetical protein
LLTEPSADWLGLPTAEVRSAPELPCAEAHPASIVADTITTNAGRRFLGGGWPSGVSAIVSIPNYHLYTDAKHHSVATSENSSSTTFVNKGKAGAFTPRPPFATRLGSRMLFEALASGPGRVKRCPILLACFAGTGTIRISRTDGRLRRGRVVITNLNSVVIKAPAVLTISKCCRWSSGQHASEEDAYYPPQCLTPRNALIG